MGDTARLYDCGRCHRQVFICNPCDRGNIYCGPACSEAARKTSLQAAGKRYQSSRRGRFKHADRQRRYRAQSQKVTHQGSARPVVHASLSMRSEPAPAGGFTRRGDIHCHRCDCLCNSYLRLNYLRRIAVSKASARPPMPRSGSICAQGP